MFTKRTENSVKKDRQNKSPKKWFEQTRFLKEIKEETKKDQRVGDRNLKILNPYKQHEEGTMPENLPQKESRNPKDLQCRLCFFPYTCGPRTEKCRSKLRTSKIGKEDRREILSAPPKEDRSWRVNDRVKVFMMKRTGTQELFNNDRLLLYERKDAGLMNQKCES